MLSQGHDTSFIHKLYLDNCFFQEIRKSVIFQSGEDFILLTRKKLEFWGIKAIAGS